MAYIWSSWSVTPVFLKPKHVNLLKAWPRGSGPADFLGMVQNVSSVSIPNTKSRFPTAGPGLCYLPPPDKMFSSPFLIHLPGNSLKIRTSSWSLFWSPSQKGVSSPPRPGLQVLNLYIFNSMSHSDSELLYSVHVLSLQPDCKYLKVETTSLYSCLYFYH